MEKIIEQIKKIFSKESLEEIKAGLLRDKRYVGVAAILVVFIIVLAVTIGGDKKRNNNEVPSSQISAENFEFTTEFEQDDNAELTKLLESYYKAFVAGDVDAIGKIAYPMSDNEKSYISVLSNYYEDVTNINCYSKPGLSAGSYFVSSSIEIKFKDVETKAPTLDFFYVETDENGKLYINNLYCIYNLNFMENACDPDVYAVVQKYMAQEDFIKLQQEVQNKYNDAVSADENLYAMISTTLNNAIRDWQAGLSTSQQVENTESTEAENQPAETEKKEEQSEEQKVEEQQPEEQVQEQPAQEQTQSATTYKTKDVVNVRSKASKDSSLIGVYGEGALINKTGEEGEWTIIDFNGTPGYVKTEFIEPVNQ